MMRTAAKLAVIFALVTIGVHLGYRRLEEELRKVSCVPQQPSGGAATEAQAAASSPEPSPDDAPAPEDAALEDFKIIVRRNIFQVKQAAPPPAAKPPENKPQQPQQAAPTSLNLILAGTVTGTEETARAIIIDNAGKKEQQLLRVGDGVQGAIIKAIEWNKVTLDVNGRLEILKMPEVKPGASGGPPTAGGMPPAPPPFHAGPPDEEAMRGMMSARPNRRVSLPPPPDYDHPPEEEPHFDEPPPDLPEIIEEPPPEEELPPPEPPPMETD